MKTTRHTIKMDPLRSLVIEPSGTRVVITVTVAGANLFSQTGTVDQAKAIAAALITAAEQATWSS